MNRVNSKNQIKLERFKLLDHCFFLKHTLNYLFQFDLFNSKYVQINESFG
jgi:hypothetical protein